MNADVLSTAQHYVSLGLSPLPIRGDKTKKPLIKWKHLEERHMTPEELAQNFKGRVGVGIVGGAVSGNLEIIDFDVDNDLFYPQWRALVAERGGQELLDRLVIVQSPRPGYHLYYRCVEAVEGNQDLALRPRLETDPPGDSSTVKLIETRAEGGYIIAPGTPGHCHPTGREYQFIQGSFEELPTITGEERQLLLDAARSFHVESKPKKTILLTPGKATNTAGSGGLTVWDDFNARASWSDILTAEGWTITRDEGGEQDWLRPKSKNTHTATLYADTGKLTVFSTSIPGIQAKKALDKYGFVLGLKYGGDNKKARKALADLGYGDQKPTSSRGPGATGGKSDKARDLLLELVQKAELWQDDDGEGYATIKMACTVHHMIDSQSFKNLLRALYCHYTKLGASDTALKEAIDTLKAQAMIGGKRFKPALRFAAHGGKVYLDLCNDDWSVVEIDGGGYRVITSEECPVRFHRTKFMYPIALPVARAEGKGALNELRDLLGVPENNWRVILSVVAFCLMGSDMPLPILLCIGEQGTGKSLLLKLLKMLIDPGKALLSNLPADRRDHYLKASSSAICAFDNVSKISDEQSDTFCCVSTGGAFETRKLYENTEMTTVQVKRPQWVNGISEFARRDDFKERSEFVYFPNIPDSRRKTEDEILGFFEANRARLLADLLNVVCTAIKGMPGLQIDKLPRMADYFRFGSAAAPALGWTAAEFAADYFDRKESEQAEVVIDSGAGAALVQIMRDKSSVQAWTGKSSDLTKLIKAEYLRANDGDGKYIQHSTAQMTTELNRIGKALRTYGLDIQRDRNKHGATVKVIKTAAWYERLEAEEKLAKAETERIRTEAEAEKTKQQSIPGITGSAADKVEQPF